MSIVKIPPGTYAIESIKFPGRVLDLRGGSSERNLQYLDEEKLIFTLQAVSPSSNIFSSSVSQNTQIVRTPLQQLGLQACATGGASVYQIIVPTQPGTQNLAFFAGNKEDDQFLLALRSSGDSSLSLGGENKVVL
ncbi:hypothetical protein Clacol_005143 [Clathrus columnatus]|uniref:Uncharacterized protein n=1 Tax=Clathrus columnatus TaxID=1419009 RepID=A0AAV5AG49_9AGAM|nr:hypothetical protein Clacol_005143 [Clathrus columnatus]